MVQTIIAIDPRTRFRGLLVEIYQDLLPEQELNKTIVALERRLFDRNIYVGLIATPKDFVVVHDRVTELDFTENRFEVNRLPTDMLFEHAGLGRPRQDEGFFQQVQRWLQAVGASWFSSLWPGAVKAMVPNVVGYLAQAELEEINGLVDQSDAA